MFKVKPDTVELLFNAQKPELRGRLRLDISSRCYPADPAQPLDMRCAVEALGERLIGVMKNCAAEAVLFGGKDTGFDEDVIPPAPVSGRLRIMPSADNFEPYVLRLLDEVMGLDRTSADYGPALRSLARDFLKWARSRLEACDVYGFEVDEQDGEQATAFVRAEPWPPEEFTPLNRGVTTKG